VVARTVFDRRHQLLCGNEEPIDFWTDAGFHLDVDRVSRVIERGDIPPRRLHTMLRVGEAKQIVLAVAIRWRLQLDLGE
jgi:hypothetical protein